MILSGKEILKHMGKEIIITPFDEKRINPNSYNLSLADELLVYEKEALDMKKPNPTKRIVIRAAGLGDVNRSVLDDDVVRPPVPAFNGKLGVFI